MLILVRHGRTMANARALLQGRADHPLDDVGVVQAARVAEAVRRTHDVARVLSSPLVRAQQTAAAISDDVIVDDRFIELDYGEFDGVAIEDVPTETWKKWREDPHFRPPGGESLVELDGRVHPALDSLSDEARHHDIVIVSHVSPIKSAAVWALGAEASLTWKLSLDRASITRIAIGSRGPTLVGFNDVAHLGDVK